MGLNFTALLIIIAMAYGLNAGGLRKADRSPKARLYGIIGLVLIISAIFAVLLHSSGATSFFVGEVTVCSFLCGSASSLLIGHGFDC